MTGPSFQKQREEDNSVNRALRNIAEYEPMTRKQRLLSSAFVLLIVCVVVMLLSMSNSPDRDDSSSPVWKNSHFSGVGDMGVASKVWAIARTRYLSQGKQKIILHGSAWLFKKNSAGVAFVTVNHVLQSSNVGFFDDLQGDIRPASVTLQHISGIILPIERENIVAFSEKDIAFIILILPKERLQELRECLSELSTITGQYHVDDLIGKDVYNLGFPLQAQKAASQKRQPYFGDVIRVQYGKILNGTIESHIFKSPTKCFVLDYVSEPGFSGGPLFLKESDQVIGIMQSCSVPEEDGELATKSIAICMEEIYDTYRTKIRR